MSYDKNTWATGDTITAQKLNHMEDGISGAGGVLVAIAVYDEQTEITTLDKTWQQIHDAPLAVCNWDDDAGEKDIYILNAAVESDDTHGNKPTLYFAPTSKTVAGEVYVADTKDSYPVLVE